MVRWGALLLVFAAVGCTMPDHPKGLSWLDQVRARSTLDPNAVILELALIERPAGDPFINDELWMHTDELIVDLERRAALEENGLRVGQLVGTPPTGFQTLLLSKRSCSAPASLMVPTGKRIPQYLSPVVVPHCRFEYFAGDVKDEIEADQARFCLEIVPTLTSDGRTKLAFTPRLETGEALRSFHPAPEEAAWVLRVERPSKTFADLRWEATLAPGQYLVIGGRIDKANRLGHCAFVEEDGTPAVQRLLVLRTARSLPSGAGLEEFAGSALSPPLALQAAIPAARAKGQ